MVSDTDNMSPSEGEQTESMAKKIDQFIDSIRPEISHLSEEQVQLLEKGVKTGFTIILVALVVYWLVAYRTGIQLFHF